MARTESVSTEAAASSSSSASPPSSASNNNHNSSNESDPSRPPSGLVMASASAAAAASSFSSMSISDLAPFVASVLRDKAMADLIAESKRKDEKLQQQQEDRLRLELMGPGGRPVYFKKSMKDGVSTTEQGGIPSWDVIFEGNDDNNTIIIPNFIETVIGLELRLGGIVEFKFNQAKFWTAPAEVAGFDRTRDDKPQMANVGFNNASGVSIWGRVGPILYEDYINLTQSLPHQGLGMKVPDFVRFLKDHQTNNNNDTVLLPQLQIVAVTFMKSQIPGILPLLEDTTGERSTSE